MKINIYPIKNSIELFSANSHKCTYFFKLFKILNGNKQNWNKMHKFGNISSQKEQITIKC